MIQVGEENNKKKRQKQQTKNLSKFQCHKFLHRTYTWEKEKKEKKTLLNFIIKRSTIIFSFFILSIKTGFFYFGSAEILVSFYSLDHGMSFSLSLRAHRFMIVDAGEVGISIHFAFIF